MSVQYYKDVSVSIGGVTLGEAEAAASFERRAIERPRPVAGPVSALFLGPGPDRDRLLFELSPNQRGVTMLTLLRRTLYGGRKARSARRRLLRCWEMLR